MTNEDDMISVLLVSNLLGYISRKFLEPVEEDLDKALKIVSAKGKEDPDNQMVPIMMNLLVSAKDLVSAHKVIDRVSDIMSSGGMHHDGPERVQ